LWEGWRSEAPEVSETDITEFLKKDLYVQRYFYTFARFFEKAHKIMLNP
jgi:hypothetical protein